MRHGPSIGRPGGQRDARPRPDPRGRHRRRAPPLAPRRTSSPGLASAPAVSAPAASTGTRPSTGTGPPPVTAPPPAAAPPPVTGPPPAAPPPGRLLATSASAASAWARCSACGRDTSLARIAALPVTFIAATRPSSPGASRWTTRPGPGTVEPVQGDDPGRPLWRHRNFLLLWGGQTVSEMGSAITQLALPLTAVARAPGVHVRGRPAHLGGDPRVRADRPAGRRHRGPAHQAVADDLVRPGPDG